jgi:hypothetical protein
VSDDVGDSGWGEVSFGVVQVYRLRRDVHMKVCIHTCSNTQTPLVYLI